MNKIPCEVIQDLLPSYVDNLTSDMTNQLVKEHIEECSECAKVLSVMAEPEAVTAEEQKELDFLKKNKKHNQFVGMISIAVALVIVIGVLARVFLIGDEMESNIPGTQVTVNGTKICIEGKVAGISYVGVEEQDGVVYFKTKQVLASAVYQGDFHKEYTADTEVKQVCLNGFVVWENGIKISDEAAEVYNTRHDYMGDICANVATAQALRLSDHLGSYTNELLTDKQPYEWVIRLDETVKPDEKERKEQEMESAGYVMLAVIGNLGTITYEYTSDGQSCTKTITTEEATTYLGQDIKEYGNSAEQLMSLFRKLGL